MQTKISLVTYSACPACHHTHPEPFLRIKDHSISREEFEVWKCPSCTLVFTQHVPDAATIGPYYAAPHYVSHSDTDEGLVNRLYQQVKKITIRGKLNMIRGFQGGSKGALLDIGCGTGSFLAAAKTDGWQTTGLEPDARARTLAMEKAGGEVFEPEKLYGLPPASFDVITLWHVLEHVHDLQGYASKFSELLKPGGTLVVAVPNHTSYDARFYKEYWAAWDVPRHLYHFSPEAIRLLFTGKGFTLKAMKPMWFDSFYVSMLSEQYRDGSIFRAGLVGLWSNVKALFNTKACSSLVYVFRK